MNSKELRSLQEAYLEVASGQQLDEISKKLARNYLDKSQKDIEARRTRGDKASKRGDTQYRDTEYMKSYDRERGQSRAIGKLDGKRDKFPAWSSKVPATGEDPRSTKPKEKEKSKGIKGFVKRLTRKEEVSVYDIVLTHLLDEGYAETPEAAEAIMVNMSEEWRDSITG